jgi:hypothetical protein
MLFYLPYIVLCLFVILLSITFYIKVKYRFWSLQPVFHVYNINYMLFPPGIIDDRLPRENKYTNFKNIETIEFSKLSDIMRIDMVNFIQLNYYQNGDNKFLPMSDNIIPYFANHNAKCLLTFYNDKEVMVNLKKGTTVDVPRIKSVITSRPLHVIINNDKNKTSIDAHFDVYYVDYLCVDKFHRKKGIAPEMIQTHNYNQRHINKTIAVSLFKREDELTGIVPLCAYNTYGFSVLKWTKPLGLLGMYNIIEIVPQNMRLLIDFLKINGNLFDIIIYSDFSNINELIKTKNIFINAIIKDDEILAVYFFRKTCVYIEKDLEILSCFSSIKHEMCDQNIFIQGFKISFWNIAEKNNFGFCSIENISHNNIIIDNILIKTKSNIISPCAYFFYNFAYPTFHPNKTFIIN